jgi:hypothetical protein
MEWLATEGEMFAQREIVKAFVTWTCKEFLHINKKKTNSF